MSRICYNAMFAIGLLIGLLIVASASSSPRELPRELKPYMSVDLIASFEEGRAAVNDGDGFLHIDYQLFVPIAAECSTTRFPLILLLNGHGQVQEKFGNLGQLKHIQEILIREPRRPEEYPFFLLAPRCPVDEAGRLLPWFSWSAAIFDDYSVDPLEGVIQVLDAVDRNNMVDKERVYIVGISSGGTAAWELARRYPDRFAAVIPMASHPNLTDGLQEIRQIPIWAFHSSGDGPDSVRRLVDAITSVDGKAHLTLLESTDHDCWNQAFNEYDAIEWLLAQRKGEYLYRNSVDWHLFRHDYLSGHAAHRLWTATWPRTPVLVAILAGYAWWRKARKGDVGSLAGAQLGEDDAKS